MGFAQTSCTCHVVVVTQARQQSAVNKQKVFRIHTLLQEVARIFCTCARNELTRSLNHFLSQHFALK
jgi:hypothetical protein